MRINTNQYKAVQIITNHYKSIEIDTIQYESIQNNSNQYKSIQINTKSIQIKTNQCKSIQIHTKSIRINADQYESMVASWEEGAGGIVILEGVVSPQEKYEMQWRLLKFKSRPNLPLQELRSHLLDAYVSN